MKPPTEKQIRYARFLARRTNRLLPDGYETDQAICGEFIFAAKRGAGHIHPQFEAQIAKLPEWAQRWCYESKYVDADIIRILSGGPLKNEPGPWGNWKPEDYARFARPPQQP